MRRGNSDTNKLKNKSKLSPLDIAHLESNKRSLPSSPTSPSNTANSYATSATKKSKLFVSPNRYSVLAEGGAYSTDSSNGNPIDVDAQSQRPMHSATHTQKKIDLPPPIFVKGEKDFFELSKELAIITGPDSFSCKSTSSHLKLQLDTADNYRKIIHFLKDNDAEYHTYQLKSDKAFRVVLRNLHPSTPVSEISAAIEEIGHTVRQVTNIIHRQTKIPLPLFFVDLEIEENNRDIFDVKSILYTKIKIEEPHKQRQIPQCLNCQSYGHTKSHCSYTPRCVKCGGNHLSTNCSKSREIPATCALCNANYPANYKGCTVYKELQQRRHHFVNYKHARLPHPHQPQHPLADQSNYQPANQPTSHATNKTSTRSYANVTGNDTTQNNSSTNINLMLTKFLDELKSVVHPLITLLTTVITKLIESKNDK